MNLVCYLNITLDNYIVFEFKERDPNYLSVSMSETLKWLFGNKGIYSFC